MKPILLLDGGMRSTALGRLKWLKSNDFADKGILKVARRERLKLERFLLVESPDLGRKEARELVKGRKGVIIGGAGIVHPADDSDVLGFTPSKGRITSGTINTTMLRIIEECCSQGVPLLGICYGHQIIARFAGDRIVELPEYEFGFSSISTTEKGKQDALFAGLPGEMQVAEYHFLGLTNPTNVEVLAANDSCVQAIKLPGHKVYGVQFHPDFHHDADGNGTSSLQHYYELDQMWKHIGERTDLDPADKASAYTLNNAPLLNFSKICDGRD